MTKIKYFNSETWTELSSSNQELCGTSKPHVTKPLTVNQIPYHSEEIKLISSIANVLDNF